MTRKVLAAGLSVSLGWLWLAGVQAAEADPLVVKKDEKKTEEKKTEQDDEDEKEVKPAESPEKLIQVLRTGDFDQRQAAAQGLKAYGEEAREALEKAAQDEDDLEVKETAQRLLGLLSRATIRFEAMDRSGNPLPEVDADVNFYSYTGQTIGIGARNRQTKSIVTDKDGYALVKGIAPAQTNVNVGWKGAFPASAQTIYQVNLHQGENRIQYVLSKGARMRATVVDAETGKPVENATLALIYNQGYDYEDFDVDMLQNGGNGLLNSNNTGGTDAKGEVAIDKIQHTNLIGIVRHDDYVPLVMRKLTLREGEETVVAEPIKLEKKAKALGSIKVRLMDGDKPAAKGKAFVEAERSDLPIRRDVTRMNVFMRMQWGMGGNEAEQEADENGVIELKDRRPGTYRITVSRQGMTPVVLRGVKVEAAATASVDAPKPGPGGKIAGKMLNASGKGQPNLQILALPVEEAQDLSNQNGQLQNMFWYRRQRFGGRGGGENVVTNAEGAYEVKGLAPGEYAILTFLPNNRMGIVWGVKVEDGKTAAAPELKIPANEKAGGKTVTSMRVVGTVTKPDGSTVDAGNVTMLYRYMGGMSSGSWSSGLAKGGKFNFNRSFSGDDFATMEPYRLLVRISGYKPKNVDLTKDGLNLDNLDVRLEAQTFGKARFAVKDGDGQPLKGVRVTPVSGMGNRNYYGRQAQPKTRATNDKGEVYFSGLASGTRSFLFALDGYYLETPVELEVPSDGEGTQSVTMKKALELSGTVALPASVKPSVVVLILRSSDPNVQAASTSGLDEQGRYRFENLQPGKYTITTAHPRLTLVSDDEITLEKASVDLPVKMDAVGGMKVDLGEAGRNRSVWITPPGMWDPAKEGYAGTRRRAPGQAWAGTDDKGVASLFGVAPGAYDLVIEPDQTKAQSRNGRASRLDARCIVRDVKVVPLEHGFEDLEKMPATPVKPAEGSATVTAMVKLKEEPNQGASFGNMSLGTVTISLVGEASSGSMNYNLPSDFSTRNAPVIVGEVPEALKPEPQNRFCIDKLPPGEYRIYASMTFYNRYGARAKAAAVAKVQEDAQKPRLLKTVTVEAGKTLDLGDLELELNASLREHMLQEAEAQMEMNYGSEIGDDEPEIIRP
ncbi:MAG: hypothetical protein KIS92_18315 [Planctomycetota bacterium]|nr:hypothetical protein [Planctomycetota bacterium]